MKFVKNLGRVLFQGPRNFSKGPPIEGRILVIDKNVSEGRILVIDKNVSKETKLH